jgi:hypothetical protein
MKATGTAVYQRQHKRGPTLAQLSAIDLLASGKTDKETAELLNLSRTCITKWRLYDPVFQAALNLRRAEVWGAGINRLRSLIPKALDALADELERPDSPNRLKAAGEILRLAQLPAGPPTFGPTDPEQIVRLIVEGRRSKARGPVDDCAEYGKGLPPFDRHMEEVRKELEALANEPEEADAEGDMGSRG